MSGNCGYLFFRGRTFGWLTVCHYCKQYNHEQPCRVFGACVFFSGAVYLGGELWMFSFSRYLTVFQSVCTNLNSHQDVRILVPLNHQQHWVFSVFFVLAILVNVVTAHCAFNLFALMTDEVEHLLCPWATRISSFVQCLLPMFLHWVSYLFLNDLWFFVHFTLSLLIFCMLDLSFFR